MTLAAAITRAFGFSGSLEDFCRSDSRIRVLRVIEVNPSGTLSRYLELVFVNTSSTLFLRLDQENWASDLAGLIRWISAAGFGSLKR